jgi:RNA polymerase sigma factor (sigma-70 family)
LSQTAVALSDRQLLLRFTVERDEAVFAELVGRHGALVLNVCRRTLRREQDAEDAFQAAFLVLAKRAATIRKGESVASWLYGVAWRCAGRLRRDLALRRRHEQATAPSPVAEPGDPSWREVQEALHEELARLPEKYRAPLVLCYVEGRTQCEAARQLGWGEQVLRGRVDRGRERLRQRLVRRGITLSAALLAGVVLPSAPLSASLIKATLPLITNGAGAQVAAVAGAVCRSLFVARLRVAALVVFTVVAVSAVGFQLAVVGNPSSAVSEQADQTPKPQPVEATAKKGKSRTDCYGDPLPDDAIARLGTQRFWCGDTGIQIAYSREGSKILVANWGSAIVLDATTGKQLRQIRPAGNAGVNSISLSPDGKLLALGTDSHEADKLSSIQIFDMETGQLLRQCKDAGRQQYLGVRFSPDGKLLASYSYPSKTVYLWDPATAEEVRRWKVECETSTCFAFSWDSKTLLVGDRSTIHFWNIATGTETRLIEGHPGVVYRLALSKDGKLLASRGLKREVQVGEHERDNKLCVWDTATSRKLHQIEVLAESTRQAKRVPDMASAITYHDLSPDGKSLVTASGDGILRVWDPVSGKELRRWDTAGWAGAFAFAPDGKTLASLGSDHTVRLWDPATGKEQREHPGHRSGFLFFALSPDGRTLASGYYDRDVRLWDLASGREQRRILAADDELEALQFSADGRMLTTIGDCNSSRHWDVVTGKEIGHIIAPIEGRCRHHAVSPDGKIWASQCSDSEGMKTSIVLWNAATGAKLHELISDQSWIGALGFSPDGRKVYSWTGAKKVYIWDVATGKLLRDFPAGTRQSYKGMFSGDGKWFACRSEKEGLLLYELASGHEVRRFKIQGMNFVDRPGLAFSPDGRTLAVGDTEGAVHVVELASGQLRHTLSGGHQAGIMALIYSVDSERLISGSEDTTALVWDLIGRQSSKREPFQQADLAGCWTDLVGDDAAPAYRAIRKLIASPNEAVAYLRKRLVPVPAPDAKRQGKLIADLDSDTFAVRDTAMKELTKLGELAAPALREALSKSPSPESRRRIQQLLAKLETIGSSGEPLRQTRAVEVLEHMNTPEARQLLQRLANGTLEAHLTREARVALERRHSLR